MGITRRLEGVRLDLTTLAEQGKIESFLNNAGDANKLGGLLEDIRDAIMDYQVCTSPSHLALQHVIFEPDFIATRYLRQELPAHREFHPFAPRSR